MSHPEQHEEPAAARWKRNGVRVVPGDRLDPNTALHAGHVPGSGLPPTPVSRRCKL